MKRMGKLLSVILMGCLMLGLTGCGIGGKALDFKSIFTYTITGFNHYGSLNGRVGDSEDDNPYIDYNDKNNQKFLSSISYRADQGERLSNGDVVNITITYNEELAKKSGIRPVHDQFSIKVNGLPEMATETSQVSSQFEHLKAENLDYLQQALNDSYDTFDTHSIWTGYATIQPDTLRYLGSALYFNTAAGYAANGSDFVSLYSAKVTSSSDADGQHCYIAIWIPQNAATGNFDTDNLYLGDNLERVMARDVDYTLYGVNTLELKTSSAGFLEEQSQLPDESLLLDILDQVYSGTWNDRTAFAQEGTTAVSSTLADTFGSMTTTQSSLNKDIEFKVGQTCYTLDELRVANKENVPFFYSYKRTLECGESFEILELYRNPKYSDFYGEVFARIGDDEWIQLEDKKQYYCVPEDVYSVLIQNDTCLMKDEPAVSPYNYPTDADEAAWLAENEPELDENGNLVGDYEVYVCVCDSYQYSVSGYKNDRNWIQVNKYYPGDEVKIYDTRHVNYSGTYGRIGKDEWVMLFSDFDDVYFEKK